MAITLKDIEEEKMRISEGRKKLDEEEAALCVLERMIAGTVLPIGSQQEIDLGKLQVNIAPPKKSLITLVGEVVQRFGSQEFTVESVERVLEAQGNLPKGKTPRASIAMALTKLEQERVVIRTYRGVGSEPHRFKKAITAQEAFGSEDDL